MRATGSSQGGTRAWGLSTDTPSALCLLSPGTSLGSVTGGNISKGVPSARAPAESPVTYRGSITHVSAWGGAGPEGGAGPAGGTSGAALIEDRAVDQPLCPLCDKMWHLPRWVGGCPGTAAHPLVVHLVHLVSSKTQNRFPQGAGLGVADCEPKPWAGEHWVDDSGVAVLPTESHGVDGNPGRP